jgi:hypothetical protein
MCVQKFYRVEGVKDCLSAYDRLGRGRRLPRSVTAHPGHKLLVGVFGIQGDHMEGVLVAASGRRRLNATTGCELITVDGIGSTPRPAASARSMS